MYILIDEHTIQEYNNEILQKKVGTRCIQTISNPTSEQLREFGYMELIEEAVPEHNSETQYLTFVYSVVDGDIHKIYSVEDIQEEPEIQEEIVEE